MIYYRVLPNFDGYNILKGKRIVRSLIGNELYTDTELKKYNVPNKCVTPVEVSMKSVYHSFGARFEAK